MGDISSEDFANHTEEGRSSWWSSVELGPPDVTFRISEDFRNDDHPMKVNVGMGAYRNEDGMPYVLSVIKEAEKIIVDRDLDKEYANIAGLSEFTDAAIKLALGKNNAGVIESRNATVQGISGTGSLRIGAVFLKHFFPGNKTVYISDPSWANHIPIFTAAGLSIGRYRYVHPETNTFDFAGAMDDISNIPEGSILLMQTSAHNPVGSDPTPKQWDQLSQLVKQKKLFPFFDMCYQGFATGSIDDDAYGVRKFSEDGHCFALAQSFSKNMGLYGERVGAFTLMCNSKEEASRVMSQLKILIRPMYSNPPIHGARIAATILNNQDLYKKWVGEVKTMTDQLNGRRANLVAALKKEGSTKDWSHITSQKGFFAFTGLKPHQVQRLTSEYGIHLFKDGRISIVRLRSSNIQYLAHAIHQVSK